MNRAILRRTLALAAIPVCLLILQAASVAERKPFYASWSDPTYYYFFTSLNMATGDLRVDNVQHPGTPLHLYATGMFRLLHLFRPGHDLVDDALRHPEWYLFRFCLVQCLLMACALFAAGRWLYRRTGSLSAALLVQLTPLVSIRNVFFSTNLMSEFVVVICSIGLAPLIVAAGLGMRRRTAVPAILGAIMTAGKVIALPAAAVWPVALTLVRDRLRFAAWWTAAFLLFTMPAWRAAGMFADWIGGIALHTGSYGAGKPGLLDPATVGPRLAAVFSDCLPFTLTFFALPALLLIGRRKKRFSLPPPARRIMWAAWLAMLLQVVLVVKHFSTHYLIPVYALVAPVWALLLLAWPRPAAGTPAHGRASAVAAGVLAAVLLVHAARAYGFYPGLRQPGRDVRAAAERMGPALRVYDCHITAPWPEPALYFGVNYCGARTGEYIDRMEAIHGRFFEIDHGEGLLRHWKTMRPPDDVLPAESRVLYYASDPAFDIHVLRLGHCVPDSVFAEYRHPVSGESVHLVRFRLAD